MQEITNLTQVLLLGLVFLFSGFVAYLNYKAEHHLIQAGKYTSEYRKKADIKFGLVLTTIGAAIGVSLLSTGQMDTAANLGFFVPAFTGIIVIITSFIEGEIDLLEKKKKN